MLQKSYSNINKSVKKIFSKKKEPVFTKPFTGREMKQDSTCVPKEERSERSLSKLADALKMKYSNQTSRKKDSRHCPEKASNNCTNSMTELKLSSSGDTGIKRHLKFEIVPQKGETKSNNPIKTSSDLQAPKLSGLERATSPSTASLTRESVKATREESNQNTKANNDIDQLDAFQKVRTNVLLKDFGSRDNSSPEILDCFMNYPSGDKKEFEASLFICKPRGKKKKKKNSPAFDSVSSSNISHKIQKKASEYKIERFGRNLNQVPGKKLTSSLKKPLGRERFTQSNNVTSNNTPIVNYPPKMLQRSKEYVWKDEITSLVKKPTSTAVLQSIISSKHKENDSPTPLMKKFSQQTIPKMGSPTPNESKRGLRHIKKKTGGSIALSSSHAQGTHVQSLSFTSKNSLANINSQRSNGSERGCKQAIQKSSKADVSLTDSYSSRLREVLSSSLSKKRGNVNLYKCKFTNKKARVNSKSSSRSITSKEGLSSDRDLNIYSQNYKESEIAIR